MRPAGAPSRVCTFRKAVRGRPALLTSTEVQRHTGSAGAATWPSLLRRGRSSWVRSSPNVRVPLGRSAGLGPAPQPSLSATFASGGGAGSGGAGAALGGGEAPGEGAGPAPDPARRGRAPAPPASRSSRAAGVRSPGAERGAGGRGEQSGGGAGGPGAGHAERATRGPLSRAGQERRPPRGARSAECGAWRGGSRSAAAAGGVEPGPGPERTCVCEGGSHALPGARTWVGAAAREEPEEQEKEEEEEEEEGRAAAQRGPGAACAKPRPGR